MTFEDLKHLLYEFKRCTMQNEWLKFVILSVLAFECGILTQFPITSNPNSFRLNSELEPQLKFLKYSLLDHQLCL